MPVYRLTLPSSTYKQLFYRDLGKERGYEILIYQDPLGDTESCFVKILHCQMEISTSYHIGEKEEPKKSIKNILLAADKIIFELVCQERAKMQYEGTYVPS
jgi:hypothetical protein